MIARATWFGPEDRPLLGWWHLLDHGQAHAAVVIVPPLAFEQAMSTPAFRYLADRLADEGFAVLRTEVDGMGDSAGWQDDPGRFAAWRRSIRDAVDEARRTVDAPLMMVGMRGGALLAFLDADERDEVPHALVLWDPPGTGRGFLREQQALRLVGLGPSQRQTEMMEGLGFELSPADAADVRSVDLGAGAGALADHVLVLTRTGRRPERRLQERLAGHDVVWGEARGQDGLLVLDALSVVVPTDTCEEIVDWLVTHRPVRDVAVAPALRSEAMLATTPAGDAVMETIESLGPLGLFGITTHAPRPRDLTVMFIGNESRVGPARLWVETARHLAGVGITSVRFDLSGLGDSPVRKGQRQQISYAPEALEDVLTVAQQVRPHDTSSVLLVGLCSSAYAAVESALSLGARGVCLFNLMPGFNPPEAAGGEEIDERRRVAQPTKNMVLKLGKKEWVKKAAARVPKNTWWVIDRLRVFRSPAAPLELLVKAGIDVLLLCGPEDARQFVSFASQQIARMERTGRCRFVVHPELDHGMLRAEPRRDAGQELIRQALSLSSEGVGRDHQVAVQAP